MPRHFRPHNGLAGKASQRIPFLLPDGTEVEGTAAQNEKLDWRPGESDSGLELVQMEEVPAAVAVCDGEVNEVPRGKTPRGAPLFFVPEPPAITVAKDVSPWRLARMVAAEAAPQQAAYFRDSRFALLGIMNPDGSISVIEPLTPPQPDPPAQGGVF